MDFLTENEKMKIIDEIFHPLKFDVENAIFNDDFYTKSDARRKAVDIIDTQLYRWKRELNGD